MNVNHAERLGHATKEGKKSDSNVVITDRAALRIHTSCNH